MSVAGTSTNSLRCVCPPRSSPHGLPQCLGGHVRAETGPPAAQPASEGSGEDPKEALGHPHPRQPVSVHLGRLGTGVGGRVETSPGARTFFLSFHLLLEELGFSLQATPHLPECGANTAPAVRDRMPKPSPQQ